MSERKVRGSVINGYLKFVEKTWGKDGYEKCLIATELKDLHIKDGVLYPYSMVQGVINWISKNYGLQYVRKAGNHTVKNLGLLAYIVRFTSIETMLCKAKAAYQETYAFGEVNIKISGKSALATMKDVSETPENCEGWIGALEALLELTRTKGTITKTKCQLKGDDMCEYKIMWD
jgi:predicted hydrocarbon binding protein